MGVNSNLPIGDPRGVANLRHTANSDPKAAIREAAKQFEGIFMQQLMKSMRDAQVSSGMLDNSGTKLGTEMLDQQFATQMTGLRGGLSDVIAKQLERQLGDPLANIAADAAKASVERSNLAREGAKSDARDIGKETPATSASLSGLQGKDRQMGFLRLHGDAAKAAEAATGIPANFMVAQAAHESGWGRHEIKHRDGSTSFNVFGIKAGANWKGPVAEVTTTEYINGQPHKVRAKFRAYSSYEEAFTDYARLMKNNPRYSKVVENSASAQGFAQGLQKAGYATDPAYADKLTRMINTTLRLQRAMA
ncbi:flagellar assembly peptidoglycan hydrolase FlgJ [Piscinibacter sp. HJYY11]|uniref:flagellar assembly peptidoglycan hydrolase FlgJ n=1 Tax=Piscinibacter sp. HJYY11 TaxID=2801333 RepID=UPI00191CEF3D|nr:flagellar assembly peptidoglycan hydrolase FlgJ [Piscinibacter sp. HJYY11]MBL0727571.1 flagellar assembly peptidoglycan hydrolase FlgJ [Piscinibacter sp. HJYY11]